MRNGFVHAFVVSCLAAGVAHAQAPARTVSPTGRADPAHAQAAPVQLKQVVVTARRRAENLQNVPLTDTAVTARKLQDWDVTNLAGLNSFVPNIKVSQDRATSSTINVYIRGVGQSDPLWGFDPAVGVYIDDVYLARPQAALLDVLNVKRIEVLSGPQGTLYGKNTIAGAIKYVTEGVVGPRRLSVSVTGGNYGENDYKLSFATPVIDHHVYFGMSLGYFRHGGYGHVVAQPGAAPSTHNFIGEDVSNKKVFAGRANLTLLWGASSKLRLVADDILDNSNASGGHRMNDYLVPQLSNPFDVYNDMPVSRDYFHRNGFSGTYTQKLAPDLDLKIVSAYYRGRGRQFINFSETDRNLFEVPALYHDQQTSAEGNITYTGKRVKGVGGLFFMNSTACGAYNASIGTLNLLGIPAYDIYITQLVKGCVRTKSYAVYGDTTWKLTGKLDLDTGIRWNEDRKRAHVYQASYGSIAPTQLYPGQTFFNPARVPAGFFPDPGVVTDYTRSRPFVNITPRLGVDYHFTREIMGYLMYSRGFMSGGFDMRGNAAVFPGTENGYASEVANNYEIGLKSTWLDNRLRLNMSAFYDPLTDAQIGVQQFVQYQGTPQNLTAVLNAGKQVNEGASLESAWRASRALTVGLNVGYLDSYFKDYLVPCSVFTAAPGCASGASSINIADQNHPLNAPHWTVSANATYTWYLHSGNLVARAGYDWRSFTKVALTEPSPTDQPAYGLLNAHLAFTTANGLWRFSIDGENLTDKLYRVAGYDFGPPPIGPANSFIGGVSQIGFYGAPRTYSATVTYDYRADSE